MAISGTIPAVSHVAVTATDLSVSEAWYTRVLGVEPILDEDTGPFRHSRRRSLRTACAP